MELRAFGLSIELISGFIFRYSRTDVFNAGIRLQVCVCVCEAPVAGFSTTVSANWPSKYKASV